ncbi:MAG: lysophospholipid acyltransferase family protein [Chloroflexi bacterium]|nr:lysophospholipid acyltransferase family protein [Chloroflexota bacterium]
MKPGGRLLATLASLGPWLIPRRAGYALVDLLGLIAHAVSRRYRAAARANVSQVLGRPIDDPLVRHAARQSFLTSGRNFWDLCSLPHTRPTRLLRAMDVAPETWPILLNAVAGGKGVVVITGHLGAFDSGGQLLALLPTRPLILTTRTTADWLFQVVTWLRCSWGSQVEPASSGSLRRIVGHLRRGGLIALVADRDMQRNGRPTEFFGRVTTLPVGPVRLAMDHGAPLIAIFTPRVGDRYRFLAEEVPLVRSGDASHDLAVNMATLVGVFERVIRAWPDQWVIFEPLWPDQASANPPPARPPRASRHQR